MIVLRAMADMGLSLDQLMLRVQQPLTRSAATDSVQVGNPIGPLAGEAVAFTGRLTLQRSDAAALAAAAGCDVVGGVTSATTILVVGDQDVSSLHGYDKSAKHRKAEKLIQAGQTLRIMSESDFRLLIQPAAAEGPSSGV